MDVEELESGRILLIPVEPVPRHQLWAWTAESKESITRSLSDTRPSETVEPRRKPKKPRKDGSVTIEIRAFDKAVMAAELPVRKAAAKMLVLLQSLDLPEQWKHPGLNFVKLHGMIDPNTGRQLYSLRVTSAPEPSPACSTARPWCWSACMCCTTRRTASKPSHLLFFSYIPIFQPHSRYIP